MSKNITCIDINGKTKIFKAQDLKWRPSVYAIVLKGENILLSKQFGERYDLPGGGLEQGEKLEEGVVREAKEETGLDIKNPRLVGVKETFWWDSIFSGNGYQSQMFYYACDYDGGEISTDGFDDQEKEYAEIAEWIPLAKLDKIIPASSVDYRPIVKQVITAS